MPQKRKKILLREALSGVLLRANLFRAVIERSGCAKFAHWFVKLWLSAAGGVDQVEFSCDRGYKRTESISRPRCCIGKSGSNAQAKIVAGRRVVAESADEFIKTIDRAKARA
jgi:hypothetical protein